MKHLESELQRECVRWFRHQYPKIIIFAIPNARKVNIRMGGLLKAEGVLAGVSDLFILYAIKGFHGFFIEIKYDKGKQSDSQKAFQVKCEAEGYKYVVCNSVDSFKKEIDNYLWLI